MEINQATPLNVDWTGPFLFFAGSVAEVIVPAAQDRVQPVLDVQPQLPGQAACQLPELTNYSPGGTFLHW